MGFSSFSAMDVDFGLSDFQVGGDIGAGGSVAYFPCLRNGIPKGAAILIAFFMSAVFHEVAGKALFMDHVEGQLK
ncbi:hypothetical protein Tco_1139986, partial [Tanacetum coccineum]